MIERVHLEHFKCIKEQTLEGLTPIVCIVGKNGSGKSSLLQALVWILKNGGEYNGNGISLGDGQNVVFGQDYNNICICEVKLHDGRNFVHKIGKGIPETRARTVEEVRYSHHGGEFLKEALRLIDR